MLKRFNDIKGGLDLTQSSTIDDNSFTIAKNVFYNSSGQLQSRRGYAKFGDELSAPITSYFFFQRDDTQERIALCHSGNNMYVLDTATQTWSSIKSDLVEYETVDGKTDQRVRRDFASYKNVVYMGNGVDPYSKYDGSFSFVGVASGVNCTFDNSTDVITSASHGLSDNDEVYFTSTGDIPTGVSSNQVYYVVTSTTNTFQIATTVGGTAIDFSTNGTGTISFFALSEPRCRYIQYLGDRLYGAGDDANPITLYYTNAAPTDGDDLNANTVVIGGDEQGKINGLSEYSELVLVMKDGKVYTVNVATPSVVAVDSQTGGYADRTISVVENNLFFFSERGVDSLKKSFALTGTGGISAESKGQKVKPLTDKITPDQYNASCAYYDEGNNNYHFTFDTSDDNLPDTTIVYNSAVGSWTQYTFPNIYDYGEYVDDDGTVLKLFSSASGGQMYKFDYGFDDDGQSIETHIRSKPFDFDEPGRLKEFKMLQVTGYKALGNDIDISILVDGEVEQEASVTDDNLNINGESVSIGVNPIGVNPVSGNLDMSENDIDLYRFSIQIPMYTRGETIEIDWKGDGVQRIHEKFAVDVNGETIEVFSYDNIL